MQFVNSKLQNITADNLLLFYDLKKNTLKTPQVKILNQNTESGLIFFQFSLKDTALESGRN